MVDDDNAHDNPSHSSAATIMERKRRKEEGKRQKRQRIEEAGGVRPRPASPMKTTTGVDECQRSNTNVNSETHRSTAIMAKDSPKRKDRSDFQPWNDRRNQDGSKAAMKIARTEPTNLRKGSSNSPSDRKGSTTANQKHGQHTGRSSLFGRVMDQVPCRNHPRHWTVSIAVPGSVLQNCQTRELRTVLVGQIARAATIYQVDEIVVYDDKLGGSSNQSNNNSHDFRRHEHWRRRRDDHNDSHNGRSRKDDSIQHDERVDHADQQQEPQNRVTISEPHAFMARILQYCECPQYLRRAFFPMHPDLQFSGLLPPMDAPHHVRAQDNSIFREGVVMKPTTTNQGNHDDNADDDPKKPANSNNRYSKSAGGSGSLVNCGIRGRPVKIDARLTPGIRCTVQLDPAVYQQQTASITGKVVAPSTPREVMGLYWGYTVRMADSLQAVLEDTPWPNQASYDLKIGTSERGTIDIDNLLLPQKTSSGERSQQQSSLKNFHHALIVFGGVAGIEECVDADEALRLPGSQTHKLFDAWINLCPYQASRTIRTEEAILIGLAKLSPLLFERGINPKRGHYPPARHGRATKDELPTMEFSDEELSDEGSDEDGS